MLRRILTVLILVATTLPVAAQPTKRVPVDPKPELSSNEAYDVEFAGGTLEELFSAIWEQNRKRTNVVIGDDVKTVNVPGLYLSGISMLSLAHTLQRICPGVYMDTSENIIGLYGRKEPTSVQIYNIQHLVDQEDEDLRYSLEDIATTIQTGWEMYDDSQMPEMKIHEDTFLIIVEGTESEQKIVASVLDSLTSPDEALTNVQYMNRELRKLRNNVRVLASRLSRLSKEMDKLKKEKEALDMPEPPMSK